jgi:hypothetical protein
MIKLIDILFENQILIPRRSPEERTKSYSLELQKRDETILNYLQNYSKGDINIQKSQLKSLPDTLKIVKGNMELYNTSIESLPNGLTVEGDLTIMITPIMSLPENLKVRGTLYVNNKTLKSLPKNLEVGKLVLANTPIESFPNDLKIEGDLDLYKVPLGEKYTKNEIKQMFPGIKGNVKIKN